MSAHITINAIQSRSISSSSPSSPGLYVPIHKRVGSDATSSRPSSPSSTLSSDTPSRPMYSVANLLSLHSLADDSIKGKILATCPEVVMSRKTRKGLEFNGRRKELLSVQQLQMQASAAAPTFHTRATETTAEPTLQAPTPAPLRVQTRRSRPAGRAPERRRNMFSSPTQAGFIFGSRRRLSTGDDSWRLQAIPISPITLSV